MTHPAARLSQSRLARVAFSLTTAAMLLAPSPAAAQLNGPNIKGDVGLKAGSQASPGGYVLVPFYFYSADTLKDRNGREVARGSLDATIFGLGLNYVTTKKVGSANYGFLVIVPWANNRLQGGRIDENPGAGLTDMYIQPVNLGWHTPKVDTTVAYGLYVPVGRYEAGASNNTGLGMWGQEFQAGTTVFFDAKKQWHASTVGSFNVFSEKRDSDTKVGNILTLEGGVGRDLLGGGLSVGLTYYAGYKMTDDDLQPPINAIVRGKNRGYGIGPEISMALATKKSLFGLVTVRYHWETGVRVAPEGGALNVMVTFLTKPVAR